MLLPSPCLPLTFWYPTLVIVGEHDKKCLFYRIWLWRLTPKRNSQQVAQGKSNKYQKIWCQKFQWINFWWNKFCSYLLCNFGVNLGENLKNLGGKKFFRRVKRWNIFCKFFLSLTQNHLEKHTWKSYKNKNFDVNPINETEK